MLSIDYMLSWPKWQLVSYARKVKAALPHEEIFTSGTKAYIAYSIFGAVQRNPQKGSN